MNYDFCCFIENKLWFSVLRYNLKFWMKRKKLYIGFSAINYFSKFRIVEIVSIESKYFEMNRNY